MFGYRVKVWGLVDLFLDGGLHRSLTDGVGRVRNGVEGPDGLIGVCLRCIF